MKTLIRIDKKARKVVREKSTSRHLLKSVMYMEGLSVEIRQRIGCFLQQFCKRYFFSKLYGRCMMTNTSKSISMFFKVSRYALKEMIPFGKIYGVSGTASQ